MTKPTPHGQVPEALIDLIDAYAETRHRCGGIYNAKTEAARKAVIEALSGVQALSAAPAVDITTVGELQAFEAWYKQDCVIEGAAAKMAAKAAWKARAMLAASPPAEQQAQPGTGYAELPHSVGDYKYGGGLYTDAQMRDFADRTHALRMQAAPKAAPGDRPISSASDKAAAHVAREFREAAPQQEVSQDTLYLLRRLLSNQHTLTGPEFRAELEKIVGEAYQQEAQPNYVVSLVVIKETPTGFNTQNKLYAVHAGSAEDAIGKAVAQLPTDFPEHRLHTSCFVQVSNKAPQQEAQEPVGEVQHLHELNDSWLNKLPVGTKLYTTHQPAPAPLSEREAFEAWIEKDGGDLGTFGTPPNMHYRNSAVNNAWVAWKARAALAAQGGK